MTDLIPSEHQEQVAFMQWVKLHERRFPQLKLLHAIPNGGARNAATGAMLKAEGVKKGVPDICFPCPAGPYPGMYIEMKRKKGGRLSPEQKEYISMLLDEGWLVHVCHGADSAIAVMEEYLRHWEQA